MAGVIYGLCASTAILCAWLLLAAFRKSRYRLLLWSGLCFVGLAVNNLLLVLDKLVFTAADLSIWRTGAAFAAMLTLILGLVLDAE